MLTPLLLFVAVVMLACTAFLKLSARLGIPALLAFLFLGMLFGSDGLFKVAFDDYAVTEQICSVALVFIMFYGGLGTNWRAARPVAAPSILLSSAGTLLTALLTGWFCHLVLGMTLLQGLLCGAVLGSTDAASVFSILRARKLALKENTDSLLEVESGSNDPFAYMLTAVLLAAMETGITPGGAALLLVKQLAFGLAFGFGVGFAVLWMMRRLHFAASGSDTILVVAAALLAYAAPTLLGGNGFLSVYIAGIILGNGDIGHKDTLVPFFDGVTGIMQMILFFVLGLLSYPSRMPAVLLSALGIALFLTLVARPAAVFLLMAPFGGSTRQKLLISFSGLRGAASVVFAVMAVISPAYIEMDIFHIVFVVVLFSILVQGSLLPAVARRLEMIDAGGNILKTFTDYADEAPVQFIQVTVPDGHAWCGKAVREILLPPGTLLVSLRRGDQTLVPDGNTLLQPDDLLVLCALEHDQAPTASLTEKEVDARDLPESARLADLPRRKGALIVLIRRGEEYLIPNGDTILQDGDLLIINNTASR